MGESLRNQHGPANEIQICRAVYIYFYIIGDYFVFLLFRLMIYSTKSINMTPVGREIQALCVKPATI